MSIILYLYMESSVIYGTNYPFVCGRCYRPEKNPRDLGFPGIINNRTFETFDFKGLVV